MVFFTKNIVFQGIFWGMMIGLVVGVVRMILDMIMPPPECGSGQTDERLSIISRVDFLHFSIINAIICAVAMVTISLFTQPRTAEQVKLDILLVKTVTNNKKQQRHKFL